jgi:hypothetical protein
MKPIKTAAEMAEDLFTLLYPAMPGTIARDKIVEIARADRQAICDVISDEIARLDKLDARGARTLFGDGSAAALRQVLDRLTEKEVPS